MRARARRARVASIGSLEQVCHDADPPPGSFVAIFLGRGGANSEQFATQFYGRLFALDPTTRALFTGDMVEQGRKLIDLITIVINGLEYLDELLPVLVDLGRGTPLMALPNGCTAPWARCCCGAWGRAAAEFTAEVAEAWATIYDSLAEIMKSAAYAPVG